MDLINGGDCDPKNSVQSYEKVLGESFRNQYWYTVRAGDTDRPKAYNIVNIRTNTYLHLVIATDDDTDQTTYTVTVKPKATDKDGKKHQLWYFYKADDGYCRVQNAAAQELDPLTGFLYLTKDSGDNHVRIGARTYSANMTQQWRVFCRSRPKEEIEALTSKTDLLKDARNLLPPFPYLQMPNPMYSIILKAGQSSGAILPSSKALFDEQQIFAFKNCVNRWANENLSASEFYILTGLAFGQKGDAPHTAIWGLKDDDLDSIVFFMSNNGSLQTTAPSFTPNNTFF